MKPSARTALATSAAPAEPANDPARLGTRKVPRNERMAQILNVAGRTFAQRGFHSSSMEDIAKGAGVTKPLLYRYFGSKDALYLAAIEQVGQYLTHGLTLLMSNPDPQARLELMMMYFLSFVERHRDGWSVLYNETMGSVGPVGERVAYFRKMFIDAVSQSILDWVGKTGPEAALQAECLAHGMVGAGEALARWWVNNPDVSLEQLQGNFRKLVEPGLEALRQDPA